MKNRLNFLVGFIFISLFFVFSFVHTSNADIVINEIAAYEASGFEWVEIYNRGENPVDVSTWKFWEGNTNHALTLKQGNGILNPGDFAVIVQDEKKFLAQYPLITSTVFDSSWGSLSEDGEDIGLKFGAGDNDFVERFTYIATDSFSLERKDPNINDYLESNWVEHMSGNTAGQKNFGVIEEVEVDLPIEEAPQENIAPEARFTVTSSSIYLGSVITFDAKSSGDSDGEVVAYSWSFGDGNQAEGVTIEHTYTATGTFHAELTVIDNLESGSVTSTQIEVKEEAVTEPIQGEDVPIIDVSLATSAPKILLNEFLSDPSEGKEWIEIINVGTTTANLDGFTLSDGVGVIARPTTTLEAGSIFVVELSASKLNNDGDQVILKNSQGETVDSISYGIWDDGYIPDNMVAPAKGNTLARRNDDFEETTTPTKGLENIIIAPLEESESASPQANSDNNPSSVSGSTPLTGIHFSPGDIVINELLSDPGEEQQEFVELYNRTSASILLSLWKIQDGGKSNTFLDGTIAAHGFFVVEKPKGSLNNTGDLVTLHDPSDTVIDSVTYGIWEDGNIVDNASVASDPMSLSRKVDGVDSNNDTLDFVPTLTITAGEPNKIHAPERVDMITEGLAGKIFINEIFPNPTGDDSESEYIELYNSSTSTISLVGWKLGDDTLKRYTIQEKVIGPLSYAVFVRKVTDISLNNTGGDIVKLFEPSGSLVDSVEYEETAIEEQTFARKEDGMFLWTTTKTLGTKNIFASEVTTTSSSDEKEIYFEQKIVGDWSQLQISEIFPSPTKLEGSEFIEIYNDGLEFVDLSGLFLDDGDGGSKPYRIVDGTVIGPKEYKVFSSEETKLSLNNNGDSVRILYNEKDVLEEVLYTNSPESESYIQNEIGDWVWTQTITRGKENKVNTKSATTKSKTAAKKVLGKKIKTPTIVPLEKIREQEKGTLVKTTGTVVVLPEVFGTQYFYIANNLAGVQVYNNKKEFPELFVGDQVEVVGEITEASNEIRLKIANKDDIVLIASNGELSAQDVEVSTIGESFEGAFVQIEGQITEVKASNMYVDDGTSEIKVYFKGGTGIQKEDIVLGSVVRVKGIVSPISGGYQLLPRNKADIVVVSETSEILPSQDVRISKAIDLKKYMSVLLAAVIIFLAGLFVKMKKLKT